MFSTHGTKPSSRVVFFVVAIAVFLTCVVFTINATNFPNHQGIRHLTSGTTAAIGLSEEGAANYHLAREGDNASLHQNKLHSATFRIKKLMDDECPVWETCPDVVICEEYGDQCRCDEDLHTCYVHDNDSETETAK